MADYKIQLKEYCLSHQLFYHILDRYESNVEIVGDLSKYMYGYEDKGTIVYIDTQKTKRFICQERLLYKWIKDFNHYKGWRQVICTLDDDLPGMQLDYSLTGLKAKNIVNNILKQFYTKQQINQRLDMYSLSNPKDENKQVHIFFDNYKELVLRNVIYKIPNVIKYDLNGAHLDALCEIFPLAKEELKKCYLKRKVDKKWKNIPNYYVGMLVYGHRNTYNWIVNRTTQLLNKIIQQVSGEVIYANTDGVAITCPKHLLETSTELGGIKKEFEGTAYFLATDNYIVYQFEKLVGSLRCDFRNRVDLSIGMSVDYKLKVQKIGEIPYVVPYDATDKIYEIIEV